MTSEVHLTVDSLRTLHRIHMQLNELRDRLARGPRLVQAHQANFEQREAQAAQVREELKKLRVATDEKQLQLSTSEAAVEKRRVQLRQANDNREYQALKEQIAATEMVNSVLADEILEALERIDQLHAKVAQAEAAVKQARQQADKTRQETEQQRPVIEAEIRRLEGELKQVEAGLPDDFREIYQRVVRTKGVDALAPVHGEYCGGCNQHVPVNMVNALMLSKPILCKSCGRLLYLPE